MTISTEGILMIQRFGIVRHPLGGFAAVYYEVEEDHPPVATFGDERFATCDDALTSAYADPRGVPVRVWIEGHPEYTPLIAEAVPVTSDSPSVANLHDPDTREAVTWFMTHMVVKRVVEDLYKQAGDMYVAEHGPWEGGEVPPEISENVVAMAKGHRDERLLHAHWAAIAIFEGADVHLASAAGIVIPFAPRGSK